MASRYLGFCVRTCLPLLLATGTATTGCDLLGISPNAGSGNLVAHTPSPCGFNRMDALHVDDAAEAGSRTVWTGCGTNTEGTGLFRSVDGGTTWAQVEPKNSPGFFESFRVNDISRSDDGLLYVGGTGGGLQVVRLVDGDDNDDTLETVLSVGNQVGTTFPVGRFRRAPDGRALAESLTGADSLSRASDDSDFAPADLYAGESHQVLDLTLDDDGRFIAVGSTISEANLLFTENDDDDEPIAFTTRDLSSGNDGLGFTGELRAVAATGTIIVVGGVDEDADDAVMHVVRGDGDEDVETFRLKDIIPELRSSTVRGACADEDRLVVVGEETINSGVAFAVQSVDGGSSWEAIALPGAPTTLSRCQLVGGALWVAGGAGYVAAE